MQRRKELMGTTTRQVYARSHFERRYKSILIFGKAGTPIDRQTQNEMKKFNLKIFKVATVITILLTFVSWVGLEASTAENGSHTFWWAIGNIWTILRFPIFALYWQFLFDQNNLILFSTSVFLNCAFYGFVIERIFTLRRKKANYSQLPTRI
jgi:hypothetical protein